jgi:hypothetical protein
MKYLEYIEMSVKEISEIEIVFNEEKTIIQEILEGNVNV